MLGKYLYFCDKYDNMKTLKIIICLIVLGTLCGVVSAMGSGFTDYGNGVLYFHKSLGSDRPEAGADISEYLTEHPEKHIVSIAPDASVSYGLTGGFYVIVENKSINRMNCTPDSKTYNGVQMIYDYICMEE